jgi:hypothetical protein
MNLHIKTACAALVLRKQANRKGFLLIAEEQYCRMIEVTVVKGVGCLRVRVFCFLVCFYYFTSVL